MDMVSCKVQLGGDPGSVLARDAFQPVSWPEISVIQSLHGEESVYDIEFVREVASTSTEEKHRLISIYGETAVNLVYPGSRPNIDGRFPGDRGQSDSLEDRAAKSGKPTKTVRPAPVKMPAPPPPDTMEDEA